MSQSSLSPYYLFYPLGLPYPETSCFKEHPVPFPFESIPPALSLPQILEESPLVNLVP